MFDHKHEAVHPLDKNFKDVANHIFKTYYLVPYVHQTKKADIPRHFHGVLHIVCAIFAERIFMALLIKYFPYRYKDIIHEFNDDKDFDDQDEFYLKFTILCHDAGNKQEKDSDPTIHIPIFEKEHGSLKNQSADKFSRAMLALVNKDYTNKDLLRMRLHDADCWEYIRTIKSPSEFNIHYLEIVRIFKSKLPDKTLTDALEEVERIAVYYFGLTRYLYRQEIHLKCEFATDPFNEVQQAIMDYPAKQFDWLALPHVPVPKPRVDKPLEVYQALPVFDAKDYKQVKQQIFSSQIPPAKLQKEMYVRSVSKPMEELEILKSNKLAIANMFPWQKIRDFYLGKKNRGLAGFKFRPMSKFIMGQQIKFFDAYGAFLLLDPAKVQIIFRYKANVCSNRIGVGLFEFNRPSRKKNLPSEQAFTAKLEEMEARRCGIEWDNYNRHYGKEANAHSEALGDYSLSAVIAIGYYQDQQSARDALRLFLLIKKQENRLVPFVKNNGKGILSVADNDDILYWAGIRTPELKVLKPKKPQSYKEVYRSYLSIYSAFDIHCSLERHPPSLIHPITYEFKINLYSKQLIIKGYMHVGNPVLEIEGNRFEDDDGFLLNIVDQYQEKMVKACNGLFGSLSGAIKNALGIENLKLVIKGSLLDYKKKYLLLSYTQNIKIVDEKEILVFLNYPHKYEIMHDYQKTKNIKLSVVQAVTCICMRLKEIETRITESKTIAKEKQLVQAPTMFRTAQLELAKLVPTDTKLSAQSLTY